MLNIQNLSAGYGGPLILHKVNINVKEGEIVTIIGPNGAGKSTILKSIFGLTDIKEGSIEYFDEELIGVKTGEIIKRGICYVPQGRSIFPSLTVEENLQMGAFIRSDKAVIKKDMAYVYEKFPKLYERRHQKTKTMSGGEQQMVAIGRALMLQPKLLLLDEPSIGLAPKIVCEVFEKCLDIRKGGTAILMVEQNANIALSYSDRGYVLELGQNRIEGSGKQLLKNKQVGELYLGK
ncbi:ABC transporter ATP-binding protein [Patescibacteria group bacterium]|nr:ABC transporter ATP-binding protein [Patescibacteria group bacterium]MBU1703326.1 ABC transporter ATP-binding protein [Patescibacteria group bacterium]MBU1953852.1 ABC transporter ATP-binding protein [Patescibacteria group bacterium]